MGVSWISQSTTLILERFKKAVTLFDLETQLDLEGRIFYTQHMYAPAIRELCREKKKPSQTQPQKTNANRGGPLCNKAL